MERRRRLLLYKKMAVNLNAAYMLDNDYDRIGELEIRRSYKFGVKFKVEF